MTKKIIRLTIAWQLKRIVVALLANAIAAIAAWGQQPERPEPLSDNSFLIEEAYNQERGVVQHAFLFMREQRTGSWALGFTQEWPAWSARHQVSYSVSLVHPSDPDVAAGFGDLLVHYRYQLAEGSVAVAPRITVLFPTGSAAHAATVNGLGVQAAVPVSLRWSGRVTTHFNLGASSIPSVSQLDGYAGIGVVYFLHPRVNLLLEGLALASRDGNGRRWSSGTLGTAGVRWGHDFSGGLQLVPGVAWSFGTGRERDAGGPVAYLSVEYPFR